MPTELNGSMGIRGKYYFLYMNIIQYRIELVCTDSGIAATLLIFPRILPQIVICAFLLLGDFSLLNTESVMLHNVLQVTHDAVASNRLGVVAGDNAGNPLRLFVAVFVVKKELLCFPAHNNAPLAVRGADMKLTILQTTGYAVFLAELIDCSLFFAKPGANRGATVTHPIALFPGFFWSRKLLLIRLIHPLTDFAVREVKYLLSAFCAVEYHLGSSPSFV